MYLFEDKKNLYFLFKNSGSQIYEIKLIFSELDNLEGDWESSLMIYSNSEQAKTFKCVDSVKPIKFVYETILKPVQMYS